MIRFAKLIWLWRTQTREMEPVPATIRAIDADQLQAVLDDHLREHPTPIDAEKIQIALEQIASTSPCIYRPGTPDEHTCIHCRALINHARDALQLADLPAPFPTPLANESTKRHG